jgi:GTPase SAR1 family protein
LQNFSLVLHDIGLTTIPEWVFRLEYLSSLILSGNQLVEISTTCNRLQKITELNLSNNQFTDFPDVVFELSSLIELNFGNADAYQMGYSYRGNYSYFNRIREIPSKILQLDNLKKLNLYRNPIETPAPEIVNLDDRGLVDIGKIKNYFRQLEAEGIDYLYEAKLLIVGEPGAGKTTLARKIKNSNYELQRDEKSTEGIEVIHWEFQFYPNQTSLGNHKGLDRRFKVNIWDFGGQEIYHATHQFFLTKRSLYTLVADTRKEDTDFYYWLNVVELLSDNSPLLIIKNEKQNRCREINEHQLRGQFTNLKETLATNLATNRGLFEILTEIKHHISHLPHIGAALPKTWVRVREVLENDPRNYISLNEYVDICENNGFTQLKDKLQLIGYLHDLGVCLHFQDDPLLNKTVILKPEWGTDAVYKILDNKIVIRNFGKFNRADLIDIWHEEKYANMHDELLQLMLNFNLCYKIPASRDTYIAPQLVSENQPHYDLNETDNLILRYTYEFMPKGIVTRFIVAMHALITDQNYVWRSGVILERDRTRAEVIEYYGKREIRIRIAGKHKKELMTIVTYELDKIHSSYKRLKYSKLIPCNCTICKNSQEPHFYRFEILRKFIEDRQAHIQCQISYKMVNVWGLINDVTIENQFIEDTNKEGKRIIFQAPVEKVIVQHTGSGDNIMEENMKQEKVIKIGKQATISAPIIIADTIESSFNMLAESNIENELKALLDQLLKAVNEVAKETPPEQAEIAEMMARDAETLVREVSSSKPRRQWYEINLEGLKQAAINIGEIAEPVLEIVRKLFPLLLP